jgi:hypothetical protein
VIADQGHGLPVALADRLQHESARRRTRRRGGGGGGCRQRRGRLDGGG